MQHIVCISYAHYRPQISKQQVKLTFILYIKPTMIGLIDCRYQSNATEDSSHFSDPKDGTIYCTLKLSSYIMIVACFAYEHLILIQMNLKLGVFRNSDEVLTCSVVRLRYLLTLHHTVEI